MSTGCDGERGNNKIELTQCYAFINNLVKRKCAKKGNRDEDSR